MEFLEHLDMQIYRTINMSMYSESFLYLRLLKTALRSGLLMEKNIMLNESVKKGW